MQRSLAASVLAAALTATVAVTGATTSALASDGGKGAAPTVSAARARAVAALDTAQRALAGEAPRISVTMALRDLRLAYPSLSAADRKQADGILARPTDGPADPNNDGYDGPEATPWCDINFCIHYMPQGDKDAPPIGDTNNNLVPDWVETTLAEMEAVRTYEISTLSYRTPATDGTMGGDSRFDVYLANVGTKGYYGYCAAEAPVPGQTYRYSGYCVLDNDFAPSQFGGAPAINSLAVTAAHEFFHSIQFNYDVAEDRWLMEATATWMEERFADPVNDNRQYLPSGQIGRPAVPLDSFEPSGFAQYGNWVFFERLSTLYGVAAVRAIWQRLDANTGARDEYSIQGVKGYLATRHTTLPKFYAKFAAGNLAPGKFYPEGGAYPKAPVSKAFTLSRSKRSTGNWNGKLNHLANANMAFRPASTLTGRWRLRLTVNGPAAATGPAAYALIFLKSGGVIQKPVSLNSSGDGAATVSFSRATVSRVTLTLANASSRFACWQVVPTNYSCQGIPKDDGKKFVFSATATR